MSPTGRPEGEEHRSAQHGEIPIDPTGRPEGEEHRSAQHGEIPIDPTGRPEGEEHRSAQHGQTATNPPGRPMREGHRDAQHESTPTSACELVLTHSAAVFPEALREAAMQHLGRATGRSVDELGALLSQQPPPAVAHLPDEASAARLQAELERAGWRSERRLVASGPGAVAGATACRACGQANAPTARFCNGCAASLEAPRVPSPSSAAPPAGGMVGAAAHRFAGMAGLPGIQRFSLGDLVSEVFKRRTPAEVEEHLLVGTLRTTPPVADIRTDWPRPWLFARVFLGALLLYLVFHLAWSLFANPNLIPGMIMVGCLVAPFSALLLLYEFNAPRNVSLLLLVRLVTMGGAVSLLISLVLFRMGPELLTLLGASAAGLVEETGKLAAVVYATRKLSPVRYRYTLNGLVFGAAVGTGFSIFESAGYAFTALWTTRNADSMFESIFLRGLLSPFGHVIWTALAAGALWRVKGALSYRGTLLAEWRFLRIFLVGVACHVVWNSPLSIGHPLLKYFVLGFIAWAVALSLVQDGLLQVRREQRNCGV
jgi:RsiW-degrading membrane proteinase PrsW (M82 family)